MQIWAGVNTYHILPKFFLSFFPPYFFMFSFHSPSSFCCFSPVLISYTRFIYCLGLCCLQYRSLLFVDKDWMKHLCVSITPFHFAELFSHISCSLACNTRMMGQRQLSFITTDQFGKGFLWALYKLACCRHNKNPDYFIL